MTLVVFGLNENRRCHVNKNDESTDQPLNPDDSVNCCTTRMSLRKECVSLVTSLTLSVAVGC